MLSALVVFYLLVYCPTHTHTLCALLSSSSCRSFRSIYIFCGFRSIYIYLADVLEAYASLGSTHSAACCRRRARHVAPAGLRRRGGGGGILLGPAVSAAGGATHYLLPAVSIFFLSQYIIDNIGSPSVAHFCYSTSLKWIVNWCMFSDWVEKHVEKH